MPKSMTPKGRSTGLSLVELAVTLSIVAAGVAVALPTFAGMRQASVLRGHADQLLHDVQWARREAVSRNASVRLSVMRTSAGEACWVLHTGDAGACQCEAEGRSSCDEGAQPLRTTVIAARDGVALASTSPSVLFHPLRGTTTPTTTLRLDAANGDSLQHVVNIMGRVRSCVPQGHVGGYTPC